MNKICTISLLSFLLFVSIAQPQQGDSLNLKDPVLNLQLQRVYRYCYVINSGDWYKNQERLWKDETEKNLQNVGAWRNYYFAARYASMGTDEVKRTKLLRSIADKIGEKFPDSYLYPYLQYYNGDRKIEHLEKAYQLNPDCPDLYWEFIQYYELNGIKSKKKDFCRKLYSSKDIISSLYDYNFNMLNSTEQNSILFTNGDNDNYPAWVLQEAKGIRKDVTILNAHTVFMLRDYLKMKLLEREIEINLDTLDSKDISTFLKQLTSSIKKRYPEIPVHIAPTVYEEYIKEIKDRLFLTGLNYTYSENPTDNIAILKKNFEQKLRLDYLDYNWYAEDHVSRTLMDKYNLNYIPAFMKLAKMYHSRSEFDSANYWQKKALLLASRTDDKDLIKKIEDCER